MAGPGVLCGRACHIISKFLAGSMLELVGNPQEYVYSMSLHIVCPWYILIV